MFHAIRVMWFVIGFVLGFCVAKASAAERVTLETVPRIALVDTAIRVICRVPRHPENRGLTFVWVEFQSRIRYVQLDGEKAGQYHDVIVSNAVCPSMTFACVVHDSASKSYRDQQKVPTRGCEG